MLGRAGHRDIAVDRSFDACSDDACSKRVWVDEDDELARHPRRSTRPNNSWRAGTTRRRSPTGPGAARDRELLGDTLGDLRRGIGECAGVEELLHGEPHLGNVLTTKNGVLFIDLETCCRGPVEVDLAHAP